MVDNPFVFVWPVDRDGYAIEHVGPTGTTVLGSVQYDVIRPKGGPLLYYRPLDEHPGLWRQFVETCSSIEGVLTFVREFGLLTDRETEPADEILRTAERIRRIVTLFDEGDRAGAARLLNLHPPRISEPLYWNDRSARFETRLVPFTLRHALLHQAAETIASNYQWRRCRNEGCPHWFRLGQGAHTIRREFCSNRCRVAHARRQKQEAAAHA